MATEKGRQMVSLHPRYLIPSAERRSEENQRDREFLSKALSDTGVTCLSPADVAKDPAEKTLGRPSGGLQINDFELIRMIGSGKSPELTRPQHPTYPGIETLTLNVLPDRRWICARVARPTVEHKGEG